MITPALYKGITMSALQGKIQLTGFLFRLKTEPWHTHLVLFLLFPRSDLCIR